MLPSLLLEQSFHNTVYGKERPIAFASRTLLPAETRYSNIEREAYAIQWAVKHFNPYLVGILPSLSKQTANLLKALMTKNFADNPRIFKYQMRLQGYCMTIMYRAGKSNGNTDFFSRLPEYTGQTFTESSPLMAPLLATTEQEPEVNLNPFIAVVSLDTLPIMQRKDPELKQLIAFLEHGTKPTDPKTSYLVTRHAQDYILIADVLYHKEPNENRGELLQIVVPKASQYVVFQAFHDDSLGGHFGQEKTLTKIQLRYFWTRMHSDVKKMG